MKEIKLNNSGVIFNEEAHEYSYLGDEMSGITRMINRHLFPDKYKFVPEKTLQAAAERGKRIHAELFGFDMFGFSAGKSDEQISYAKLIEENRINVLSNEYLVTDEEYFATAIDKVIAIDGKVYLCDVKTTYSLDKSYLSWQLSVCRHLFGIVNPHIEVEGLKAIWVKNGECTLHDIEEIHNAHIVNLLECETMGISFSNPFAPTVSTDSSDAAVAIIGYITDIAQEIKRLEDVKADYTAKIEAMFSDLGVDKWDTDFFVITKKKDHERKGFDKKAFEAEYPELAKKYTTVSVVKGGITTKLK